MARTDSPAPSSSRAVPPVETISTPSSASPRANSTRPRLSDTVSSARRTRTSPGALTSSAPPSVVATQRLLVDGHETRIARVDAHGPRGDQADRPRQQLVLDLVDSLLDRRYVTSIRKKVERLLEDDRARVDALVDEVDRHPGDAHPVVERLLD